MQKTGCCEEENSFSPTPYLALFFWWCHHRWGHDDLPSHQWSTCFVTIASIFVWIVLLLRLPLVPPIPKFVSQMSSTCCKVLFEKITAFVLAAVMKVALWWKLGIPLLNESGSSSSSSSFIRRRRMLYNNFSTKPKPTKVFPICSF